MNEKFLAEYPITQRLKPNTVNLVYSPVGSGKTTWVNTQLVETVSDKRQILYLIDTTAGRDQIINDNHDLATEYSPSWESWMNLCNRTSWGNLPEIPSNKVPVMTFSKLAWAIKRNLGDFGVGGLKHIVLDECQNLKIFQSYGDKEDENVLRLLEYWLKSVYRHTDITITALSATPRKIPLMFPNLHNVLNEEERKSLRTLKNGTERNYLSIHNIISNLPAGKIVIYVPRITTMKEYCHLIQSRDSRNVEMIWSRNNDKHAMDARQWEIWNSILKHAIIPEGIDILMFNAACLTGVNIKTKVDYVIVHDKDPDNQIQARGRIRNDVKGLYVPNGGYIAIPDMFINSPLYKEDKEALINASNIVVDGHLKKFPTISKHLSVSADYDLTSGRNRIGGKDLTFHTIGKKES